MATTWISLFRTHDMKGISGDHFGLCCVFASNSVGQFEYVDSALGVQHICIRPYVVRGRSYVSLLPLVLQNVSPNASVPVPQASSLCTGFSRADSIWVQLSLGNHWIASLNRPTRASGVISQRTRLRDVLGETLASMLMCCACDQTVSKWQTEKHALPTKDGRHRFSTNPQQGRQPC